MKRNKLSAKTKRMLLIILIVGLAAIVEEVTKGYAAEKAGIRAGDIIVNLGGYEVDSLTTLTRVLRRFDPGQTVSVTVYRNGQQEYLTVTFDEKPVTESQDTQPEATQPSENPYGSWFDFFAPFFGN